MPFGTVTYVLRPIFAHADGWPKSCGPVWGGGSDCFRLRGWADRLGSRPHRIETPSLKTWATPQRVGSDRHEIRGDNIRGRGLALPAGDDFYRST